MVAAVMKRHSPNGPNDKDKPDAPNRTLNWSTTRAVALPTHSEHNLSCGLTDTLVYTCSSPSRYSSLGSPILSPSYPHRATLALALALSLTLV